MGPSTWATGCNHAGGRGQESATAVLAQRAELHGPPAYYTSDWESARRSVQRLAELEPERVATGHGPPLEGEEMLVGLRKLARHFERQAVPPRGRYVGQPALANEDGVVAIPPPVSDPVPRIVLGVGIGLLVGAALRRWVGQSR